MKFRALFATGLLLLCTSTFADEPQQKPKPAEQQAAQDAMMKAITPGDSHKLLDGMVGTFDAKVMMWMDPSQPPMVSGGTSENSWVLGNREVMEKFSGTFMGAPFSGIGFTGYDNLKKQYWGTWMDSMSTAPMTSTGNTSDGGKTWKFAATMPDPMSGKDVQVDQRVTVTDKDHHSMEMWMAGPDGKPFKMMEIQYTRKKG
ncbi:MAG TPA: DUF1579 domain-containing protein [Thermoanaerobaculia bacterium]|nr:DUF1579 domain-containing protein [Thermoanaerobaculia bacterium]